VSSDREFVLLVPGPPGVWRSAEVATLCVFWGRGVPNRRRWYCWVGRRYVHIGFNTNHRLAILFAMQVLTITCGERGGVVGLKMWSLSSGRITRGPEEASPPWNTGRPLETPGLRGSKRPLKGPPSWNHSTNSINLHDCNISISF